MINILRSVCLLLLLVYSANKAKAHVELDYPVGGESFYGGQMVTIQWHVAVPHITLNWDLYFSMDGGLNWEIIQLDIPEPQLSYTWNVPILATSQGRVRVVQDNEGADYMDISGDFNIALFQGPPAIETPAQDLILGCDHPQINAAIQAWLNNNGGAEAQGNCGTLDWSNDYNTLSNGCGSTGTTIVTFTVEDECGSDITTASIIVADTVGPVIINPPVNVVETCDDGSVLEELMMWLNIFGGATANDNCGSVVWSHDQPAPQELCGNSTYLPVIFTATDECGNQTSVQASFSTGDNQPPLIENAAEDLIVECSDPDYDSIYQSWLEDHAFMSVVNFCGDLVWTYSIEGSMACGNEGLRYIFTASDNCGAVSDTAYLYAMDTIAPSFFVAASDKIVECDGTGNQQALIEWLGNTGGAIVLENCSSVILTIDTTHLAPVCGRSGGVHAKFTATDVCGNAAVSEADFLIRDTTPPVLFTHGQDLSVNCASLSWYLTVQVWIASYAGAIAYDPCGLVHWSNDLQLDSLLCTQDTTIQVVFTVEDDCGNAVRDTVVLKLELPTSIKGPSYTSMAVYPNPATDVLQVRIDGETSSELQVRLYNMLGEVIYSGSHKESEFTVDLNGVGQGIYVIEVRNGKKSWREKIVRT